MKRFFRSLIYGGSGDPSDPATDPRPDAGPEDAPEPSAPRTVKANLLTGDEILADLIAHICSTMPDPRPASEIDVQLHLYDAGYLTSITAADLLAHIDARYGLDISETQLVGALQDLAALAAHIESEA